MTLKQFLLKLRKTSGWKIKRGGVLRNCYGDCPITAVQRIVHPRSAHYFPEGYALAAKDLGLDSYIANWIAGSADSITKPGMLSDRMRRICHVEKKKPPVAGTEG